MTSDKDERSLVITIPWFKGTVDYGYVTIIDTCFNHLVTFHFPVEGSFGITDKVTIEVQRLVGIIVSWRRKACPDARSKLKLQFLLKVTLYDFEYLPYLSVR